jgi:hypothetical protein
MQAENQIAWTGLGMKARERIKKVKEEKVKKK